MAKLCLVPTPLGNIEDITFRALRYLKECDILYAEDTRMSQKLLRHYSIEKQIVPFHAHNEHHLLQKAIEHIQNAKLSVLVSDAGTPGISDPGFLLVRACIENNIEVECLPGATAFVPALVCSGFASDRFCFEGFLPHKKGRESKLKNLVNEQRTIILYEAPHRLLKCLEQIQTLMGETRRVCVVREISKIYEEKVRGAVNEVYTHFLSNEPKGEIVLIIEGAAKPERKSGNKFK